MFPFLLNFFWVLIQAFTAGSLLVPALFCLLYFIRSSKHKQHLYDEELHEEKDYAIIVSAHEPSEKLYALLQSLVQLNYTNYLVYVAGNHISTADISLHNDKLVYLRTTKAYHPRLLHRFIIENFRRAHTHVAVISNDSIVDENYLTNLNTRFNQGYQAVSSRQIYQDKTGIRNILQSLMSSYHQFFRSEVLFSLGSSAALSCAGMAFTVSCYKQCLKTKTENTGFAAMLQLKLARQNHQVAFAPDAVVYRHSPFSNAQAAGQHAQRIHDWLIMLLFSVKMICKGICNRSANQLVSGISTLRLPLPTAFLIGLACLAVNIKIQPALGSFWICILLLLPVYLLVSALQSLKYIHRSETVMRTKEHGFDSIALYDPEDGYEAIMQTV